LPWRLRLKLLAPKNFVQLRTLCCIPKNNSSGIHVQNMQVCYKAVFVFCCCTAKINPSITINSSVGKV
uniref:Uncharacterized protein n=1 Tax=Macaca fascicularis TaxID=9541 RepID=A0A7N9CCX2_MACFA